MYADLAGFSSLAGLGGKRIRRDRSVAASAPQYEAMISNSGFGCFRTCFCCVRRGDHGDEGLWRLIVAVAAVVSVVCIRSVALVCSGKAE